MCKAIFKYNNGIGAILCSKCAKIIKTGIEYDEKEIKASKGEIELDPYYCESCIKYRKEIKTYDDFIDSFNKNISTDENLKYKRKGQLLMNYISEVWFDEYNRISSFHYYDNDDIDCYYNDELFNNTLNHLKKVWKNY